MFRRFLLHRVDLDSLPSRPCIINWSALEVGVALRVLDIIQLPTHPARVYAVLQTKRGEIINVWITSITYKELHKCNLIQESVFLVPLGTKLANEAARLYFNFAVIVTTNDDEGQ